MDYRDWEIIKVLYHQKNITKASQVLFISQPALTKRLKQIEGDLGVKLFNRGRRGVHFTPQGEYLAACAEETLKYYLKVKDNLSSMSNEYTGTLRLGVSNFFTKYKLPYILKLFQEQYPRVEIKVMTGWSSQVYKAIYNQDVHIGFVRGNYYWKEQKHLLFEEKMCISSIEAIDVNNLPNRPRIEYKTDYVLKSLIDNWWTKNYTQEPLISIAVDQVDTCKEMVINGLGYGILPSLILDGIKGLHKIDLTDSKGEPILRRTWMYYHQQSLELNLVRAFVNFIEDLNLNLNENN
ncbi:DNA-binding transcriptional regulator, LysR family [Peribacillus simplex]|uniref:DNA-binding transcriptional regulator, LysR family n=1 Tax=Peribacillus simplex TaxID=1478 RepID=A0A9X8RF24_9BACI|nr:LysR family transcriptional regulator [Peribacillus simplex]SIS13541.1 DNA-binding transcriptional regulator, LysR family [Peribacillus simplex]